MGFTAVQISNLRFAYPGEAFELNIPLLNLEQGEQLALTGTSGSGKTTLAGLIAGILTPQAGAITVQNEDLTSMNDAERRTFRIRHIGFVFQEFELLDYLKGAQNILLPYSINPQLKLDHAVRDRMQALAETAGIPHLLKRYPRNMSQGERQRIAICRALITQPDLLLADEPTGNLDADNSRLIMEYIHETCRTENTTLITITHDTGLLDAFDRVLNVSEEFGS